MNRVSTYGLSGAVLSQSLALQVRYANTSTQASSGLVSMDYSGVASNSKQVVSLEQYLTQAQNYIDTGTLENTRIEQSYSAVQSMESVVSNFRSTVSAALSTSQTATTTSSALQEAAQQALEQMGSLLNTQVDGRYLFSGSATNVEPVNLTAYQTAAQANPTTADTSYYQGNDTQYSYKASDDLSINYGVTANEPGFEEVLRAMNTLANGSGATSSQTTVSSTYTLLSNGLDGILTAENKLSNASSAAQTAIDGQTDLQLHAESMLSDVKNVDTAQASSDLSTLQTQLEASYSVLGTIQKLNLQQYLQ